MKYKKECTALLWGSFAAPADCRQRELPLPWFALLQGKKASPPFFQSGLSCPLRCFAFPALLRSAPKERQKGRKGRGSTLKEEQGTLLLRRKGNSFSAFLRSFPFPLAAVLQGEGRRSRSERQGSTSLPLQRKGGGEAAPFCSSVAPLFPCLSFRPLQGRAERQKGKGQHPCLPLQGKRSRGSKGRAEGSIPPLLCPCRQPTNSFPPNAGKRELPLRCRQTKERQKNENEGKAERQKGRKAESGSGAAQRRKAREEQKGRKTKGAGQGRAGQHFRQRKGKLLLPAPMLPPAERQSREREGAALPSGSEAVLPRLAAREAPLPLQRKGKESKEGIGAAKPYFAPLRRKGRKGLQRRAGLPLHCIRAERQKGAAKQTFALSPLLALV